MTDTTQNEKISITKYDLYYESRMTKAEEGINGLQDGIKEIRIEIRNIHADLRWLLGMMFAFSSIILGIMAHGFKWF